MNNINKRYIQTRINFVVYRLLKQTYLDVINVQMIASLT